MGNINIDYAKHHINPACRNAIAILRSYKKNNIYITHRDRLARFGFDLIENICKIHSTRIIEVDGCVIPLQPPEYSSSYAT